MRQMTLILILILAAGSVYAAPTAVIRGAVIRGAVIAPAVSVLADPCAGKNVGDVCPNGVLYAGTGFAGLGSYKYMTTPGNCSDFADNATPFTPTCDGTTDTLTKKWANNSGTTAYGVVTGVTSVTAGASNTTTLATNYTDTDAARYCENMVYPAGGYTDWYLPAKDELDLVLYGMQLAGKGNFEVSLAYYPSSTEYSSNSVWRESFNGGLQSHLGTKGGISVVRCVRRYL